MSPSLDDSSPRAHSARVTRSQNAKGEVREERITLPNDLELSGRAR